MGNEPSTPTREEKSSFTNVLDSASLMCTGFNETSKIDTSTIVKGTRSLLAQADAMCISSPPKQEQATHDDYDDPADTINIHPSSALFARALVSEVTDNPNTMTPAVMAEREKKLLKAQSAARNNKDSSRKAVGAPGGVGQPSVLHSIAHVLGTEETPTATASSTKTIPLSSLQENRAQVISIECPKEPGKYRVTIGLSLSRRHSTVGHADTVTRQTAFDFNELQDREYKYVSSTDSSGWRAGGGERGGAIEPHKVAAPDTVHIPIIHIDAESPLAIDTIVSALARGEVFIPHMAVLPEALSVNGISPPDLVVRFGCERNDDSPPDEWPNWSLEFMHNQLYEYFAPLGAVWTKRPFQITLAKKVRWKTVKHMNRYFAHAERVLDAWREKGAQYLDPQLAYIEGGATPEEVARPHGIYLIRNGIPTNYFCPNFEPPYTTKMTRSLLLNVLDKSWDKKRREWTCEPVPRLVTPATLMATMCGCADPTQQGFMASHVTSSTSAPPQLTAVHGAFHFDASLPDEQMSGVNGGDQSIISRVRSHGSNPSSCHLNPIDTNSRYHHHEIQDTTMNSFGSPTSTVSTPSARYGRSPTPERGETRVRSVSPNPNQSREEVMTPRTRAMVELMTVKNLPEVQSEVSGHDGSNTTVPHMNSSSIRLVERELVRQKERNEKKEMEDRDQIIMNRQLLGVHMEGTPSEEADTPVSAVSRGSVRPEQKTNTIPAVLEKALKDPRKVELARAVASYEGSGKDKYAKFTEDVPNRAVQRSDSLVSLDYSMDSSLVGGDISALSGLLGMDSSVTTSISNSSRRKRNGIRKSADSQDDSILSSQSRDGIPSDMELLAIGWAKALDPNSGSYYYFTIDRTKIVWDNPLSPASSASESIPAGAGVI